jgi:hypothetical protein
MREIERLVRGSDFGTAPARRESTLTAVSRGLLRREVFVCR